MKTNEKIFNLTEFAKQVREEVKETEKQFKIKRGETDADPKTNRDLTKPV